MFLYRNFNAHTGVEISFDIPRQKSIPRFIYNRLLPRDRPAETLDQMGVETAQLNRHFVDEKYLHASLELVDAFLLLKHIVL